MKNALNNQVGMLGDMFFWLVANLKQGVIYFIKQACGNDILASVYLTTVNIFLPSYSYNTEAILFTLMRQSVAQVW